MIPIIFLIDPHGAGKTTIGRALAAELRPALSDEIGATPRRARAHDVGAHALTEQRAFDAAVQRLRDSPSQRQRAGALPTPIARTARSARP